MFFKRRTASPEKPEKPPEKPPERPTKPARSYQRRYYRAPVEIDVLYTIEGRSGPRGATVSDLGGGGLRLETDEDLPHGTDVTVRFTLPHAKHILSATGHVVLSFWNPLHSRLADGIAFTAISPEDQEQIVRFIHEVQVEELRKRKKIED